MFPKRKLLFGPKAGHIWVLNIPCSTALPGDGGELTTLLEMARDQGKRNGLVTTTPVTHATPAAFGAHEDSRYNYDAIAQDYITQTRPNVLLGGGGNGVPASPAGYTVVQNRTDLWALDSHTEFVWGQFGSQALPYEYDYFTGSDPGYDALPHLSEMTGKALDLLSHDPDGFFLMVEGGLIDWAGHQNNLPRNVFEVLEFDRAVEMACQWAENRTDTLIVVTADHETGGLTVEENKGAGNFPVVSWAGTGHTAVDVPLSAWGVNAAAVDGGRIDNTEVFQIVAGTPEPASSILFGVGVMLLWIFYRSRRRATTPARD